MLALARDQVRRVDQYAIETLGVPGIVLMENAGRNIADAVEQYLQTADGRSIAVVAGKGNNGGDGFVVARHLSMRGARVVTFLLSSPEEVSGDAATNLTILGNLGLETVEAGEDLSGLSDQLKPFDLVIDAIGGTGITGALRGRLAQAVQQVSAAARPVVAIDIPTGLDADTGQAEGPAIKAVLTVTMLARKDGFDVDAAAEYTGKVRVVDIGIPAEDVARRAGVVS